MTTRYERLDPRSGHVTDELGDCLETCVHPSHEVKKSNEKAVPMFTGDADIDKMLQDCFDTMRKKGADYTIGSNDRLHNFRTVGAFVGMTMEQVFSVYFYKHVSALFNYVKTGGQSESEPIEGRVQDCIVYLLLFSKMLAERKHNDRPKMSYEEAEKNKRDKAAAVEKNRGHAKKYFDVDGDKI